jgi:hypothetical protein
MGVRKQISLLSQILSKFELKNYAKSAMAKSKLKISKNKGVEICVELQMQGMKRNDILQHFAKICKASTRTIDNWIKEAAPIAQGQINAVNEVKAKEHLAAVESAAKRAGVSKEALVERLAVIALGDVRKLYTIDGGLKPISDWDDEAAGMIGGLESMDETARQTGEVLGTNRKVKLLSPLEAIKILNAMLGYNSPPRAAVDEKGETVQAETVIVFGGVPIKMKQ